MNSNEPDKINCEKLREDNNTSGVIENNPKDEATNSENDAFNYLNRDFTSENFKVEIKHLPKYYGISELRKLINDKLKLRSSKIKVPKRNSPYVFVCFRNEEDRENAIDIISKFKWKGSNLSAIKAKPTPDPLIKKRKEEFENESSGKKQKSSLSVEEQIKASSIPYGEIPYEEQLEKKQNEIKSILKKLGNELAFHNNQLQSWIEKQKLLYDGLPCELLNIRHVEEIDGYRNKCEFSVGINEETNLPTVGFRCGKYMDGSTNVAPVATLRHIPDIMKKAVEVFQEFVRSSNLKVYNPENQTGHFRQLTARCTTKNQLMLIVGIHPQNLTDNELVDFKKKLVEYFSQGSGKEIKVTSLYYQTMKKRESNQIVIPELLFGESYIYETLLGMTFRISPQAFFQINTKGAELLYKTAMELAGPSDESTIVDICCGIGTIGLSFANRSKQVLGVEIIEEAVNDARENAKCNNVTNCEFFASKAEDVLSSLFYRAENDDVIAVVDPPRAGLHQKALNQLRNTRKLKKLVYLACNPNSAFKNFLDLGRPSSKTLMGEALVPVKAVGVDMFPHTPHCELIIYFERFDKVINK